VSRGAAAARSRGAARAGPSGSSTSSMESGPTGRESLAQGRGRRPTPWVKRPPQPCGLTGREIYSSGFAWRQPPRRSSPKAKMHPLPCSSSHFSITGSPSTREKAQDSISSRKSHNPTIPERPMAIDPKTQFSCVSVP
jgi:hypothetical protein